MIELNAVIGSIPASPTIVTYTGVSSSGNGGAGFNGAFGVAIDSSGDVFVADTMNNQIKEMVAVGGSVPAPTSSAPAINLLGSGFDYPEGVAVDSQGDVFVADSLNSELKEMLASGGSVPLTNPEIITYASTNNIGNTQSVSSVVIDAHNNVFFSGGGETNELAQAANFGQLTVGVGSATNPTSSQDPYQFLLFGFPTQGSIAAPAVYTQGATGHDFTDHLTGTCTTNGTSYVYGNGTNDDTCTVIVKFTPLYPGVRKGAVRLYSTSGGAPLATAPLFGVGVGPIATFQATKGTAQVSNVLPSGYSQGAGCITTDAARNIFYSILSSPNGMSSNCRGAAAPTAYRSISAAAIPSGPPSRVAPSTGPATSLSAMPSARILSKFPGPVLATGLRF